MGWLGWLSQRVSLMSVCAAGTQSVPVVWGKLWGNWFGQAFAGVILIVIAEGTDGGLLFCPRFRHSYIISSDTVGSNIYRTFLAFLVNWLLRWTRSDTTIPSEHAAACCCWPAVLPALSQATSNRKHKPSHNLTHVHNNPNLCGSRERESRRDPAVTSGCSRLHAPCS